MHILCDLFIRFALDDPDQVYENLLAMTVLNPGLCVIQGERVIMRKDHHGSMTNKVKIIIGGPAGELIRMFYFYYRCSCSQTSMCVKMHVVNNTHSRPLHTPFRTRASLQRICRKGYGHSSSYWGP